jgi:hypothetical protein
MSVRLKRMWIQLTADRKRFAMLCAALSVGMLLWARLIVVSQMPRVAVADKPATGTSALQTESPGSESRGTGAGADRRDEPIRVDLDAHTRRDPFVISPVFFPRPTSLAELLKDAGKSDSKPAEEPGEIEARITARLQAAAERLRLEAVVAGAGGSTAVINGRTYRMGEVIETTTSSETVQFLLVEVRHRSAVLESRGRQFEIRMPTPGG